MNAKAQSPAEFIIVVFVFIIILISIFTAFLAKIHPEIEKAREQESCINAYSLGTFLSKEAGQPSGWTVTGLQVFGLANGTEDYISYEKWLAAKQMGYVNVRNKTVPDTSYLLSYNIYAFKPKTSDICATENNSAVICRLSATLIRINASVSNSPATLNLRLLIPFSYAELQDFTSLEADDVKTATVTENETVIELELHTSVLDSDELNIYSFEIPKLIFIQKADYKTAGDADLQIFIGNTSVVESFGSASTGANNYCESERVASLAGMYGESFPVRFNVLAW